MFLLGMHGRGQIQPEKGQFYPSYPFLTLPDPNLGFRSLKLGPRAGVALLTCSICQLNRLATTGGESHRCQVYLWGGGGAFELSHRCAKSLGGKKLVAAGGAMWCVASEIEIEV